MGANAQTSVPVFTSGQVLTAQQQTEINTGIPVFADSTARDAAFGGTGEKTLAEGQFAFLEDTDTTQYYDGSSWEAVGGTSALTYVSSTTIGTAVSSVTVSNAFSATYDAYKIILTGTSVGSSDGFLGFQLSGLTSNYLGGFVGVGYTTGTVFGGQVNSASSFTLAGGRNTDQNHLTMDVINPFLAIRTQMISTNIYDKTNGRFGTSVCVQTSATSVSGFVLTPAGGTLTGGTIRVYGYANS
jgi:hypothetical protein